MTPLPTVTEEWIITRVIKITTPPAAGLTVHTPEKCGETTYDNFFTNPISDRESFLPWYRYYFHLNITDHEPFFPPYHYDCMNIDARQPFLPCHHGECRMWFLWTHSPCSHRGLPANRNRSSNRPDNHPSWCRKYACKMDTADSRSTMNMQPDILRKIKSPDCQAYNQNNLIK